MNPEPHKAFQDYIRQLVWQWENEEKPSHESLVQAGKSLCAYREKLGIPGLFDPGLQLYTATLDDAIGKGISVIEALGKGAGLMVTRIGLMAKPSTIISVCSRDKPHLLGLSVLQPDTEEELRRIRDEIPQCTRILAGGPVFSFDPEIKDRAGLDLGATSGTGFLQYLLFLASRS